MSARTARVIVSESGRMSIPADMRRAMGLEKGGTVSLLLDEAGLHIESTEQFMRRIQKLAKDTGWADHASVDDFIAWRRNEAEREQQELGA